LVKGDQNGRELSWVFGKVSRVCSLLYDVSQAWEAIVGSIKPNEMILKGWQLRGSSDLEIFIARPHKAFNGRRASLNSDRRTKVIAGPPEMTWANVLRVRGEKTISFIGGFAYRKQKFIYLLWY
jgi:hypothetical protein